MGRGRDLLCLAQLICFVTISYQVLRWMVCFYKIQICSESPILGNSTYSSYVRPHDALRPVYSDTTQLNSTAWTTVTDQFWTSWPSESVYSDATRLDVELSWVELRRYKRAFSRRLSVKSVFRDSVDISKAVITAVDAQNVAIEFNFSSTRSALCPQSLAVWLNDV